METIFDTRYDYCEEDVREMIDDDAVFEEMSDAEKYDVFYDMLQLDIDEFTYNLTERFKNMNLIAAVDLGLWDGHHKAFKETSDVLDLFYDYDDFAVEVDDNNDIVIIGFHHDGQNTLVVRSYEEEADSYKEEFETGKKLGDLAKALW